MKLKIYQVLVWVAPMCFGLNNKIVAQQTASLDTAITVYNQTNTQTAIGYGVQPTWMVSSAISTVKGSELQKSFTSNLTNTLYGRLKGLTVLQNSGEPGNDAASFVGRGIATTYTLPLVMIDGFENSLDQLLPDEIETISLLKDASATAIYGSRGANGVLLVTTKRGKAGALSINFSTQQGFHTAHRLPQFLGSYQHAQLFNEGLKNEGKAPRYTEADLAAYQSGNDPFFHPDVNWYDQVLRKAAPISNYNLNFRGGNNTVRYFALLNYVTSNGLLIKAGDLDPESANSRYNRFNFRSNVDIDVTERLVASLTLGGTVEDKSNPAGFTTGGLFGSLQTLAPNAFPVRNPDGSFGGNSAFSNPLGNVLSTGNYSSNGRTLQTTLKLTNQLDFITKGLSVTGAVSFNNAFRSYSIKSKQYERFSIAKGTGDSVNYTRFGQKTSLVGNEDISDQWRNTVFQGFLNYDRTFGKTAVSAMAMYNFDSYTNVDNTTTSINALPFKHEAVGGRVTLANNQKYIAEFSLSYMGSENFAPGKRFGFFPAASLGWIVSNEGFLKDNKFITYFKVRGSYGLVGNDQIGGTRFAFDQRYPYTSQYYLGSANSAVFGLAEGAAANKNVTWEKDKKMNVGGELTLFNRLEMSLDLFNHDRYDILTTPNSTVPQYVGISLPELNQAKVSNKGFEGSIRYNSNPAKAFQYFVEASAWYAKNKIVFVPESIKLYDYQYSTGQSLGQPFGLVALGLFKDAADIAASPKQIFAPVQPGDIKYSDLNGDGLVDQNDARPIGNPSVPTTTFALHSGFKFKGFDLDFLFQGVRGNTVYFGGSLFHAFQNNGKVSPIALDRWTEATAATATYPRLSATNNLNNYRFSSFWQRDGSFLKLRSIELGYTLPQNLVSKVKIGSARLFVNGTNLLSLDKLKGYIDPETRSGYPALRTVSGGVRCTF